MHPLDNVIWQALTTRQAQFAQGSNGARRFIPEVSPLSGFEEPSNSAYESLTKLAGLDGTLAVFLDRPYEPRPEWVFVAGAPLLQMVCERFTGGVAANGHQIRELGTGDSPEMLALTALTKPGPFGTRTHELGSYVGIHEYGKLVAMAGERLKVPGYTEVSAVCTHPDHLGRGYARILMSKVMECIVGRGETPFLHVRQDNSRAVALYERLGFVTRKLLHFAVLRRPKTTTHQDSSCEFRKSQ